MKHQTLAQILPVTCHTDYVGRGSTFVAIKGCAYDGVTFIPLALQKGATTIVVYREAQLSPAIKQLIQKKRITLMYVADARKALAQLSAQAAGNPAHQLKIIAVTGTKGKTTTAFILKHILQNSGYNTALLSTVQNQINEQTFSAPLTTAQPDYLHQFLKRCVESGVTHVVMEVAAQALTLHRVHGIVFSGVIFTNFGLEHLEFYDSLEEYFTAKCQLFNSCKPNAPLLVNSDDEWCKKIIAKYPEISTFGCNDGASFVAHQVGEKIVQFQLPYLNTVYQFRCPALIGSFNVSNVLGAVSMALCLSIDPQKINTALQSFTSVPGRFERYQLPNGATAIIDYAHNPLSYKALLPVLRSLTKHLIIVFGAGGDRDASRRPLMGAIAGEYADVIIVTSDNPRSEDPQKILDDIIAGISHDKRSVVIREPDRELAIKKAYALAQKDSLIALLGKGPDEYQIIGTVKTWFSDAHVIQSL
ncbi:MAG: UDP-N-acetylmuramoyl-L-alanyl-D-glutamate--2,6-diaminopimelate ligase [bacterium]|nr:UDP-N-acetylmuramoyl-L-alanyl-D-glutamate--2,6-diaminopimelate ligase [bacterium]